MNLQSFHIWHTPGDTVRDSLRRTAPIRLHSGAPEPPEAVQRQDNHGVAYLEEDLRLIRKYFPGAQTVALRTPFDLSSSPQDPWELRIDNCNSPSESPRGDMVWSR
jgi:hypothetical protein